MFFVNHAYSCRYNDSMQPILYEVTTPTSAIPPIEVDEDATDDNLDYGEGVDKGFQAWTPGSNGRDLVDVIGAVKRMENRGARLLVQR